MKIKVRFVNHWGRDWKEGPVHIIGLGFVWKWGTFYFILLNFELRLEVTRRLR